MMTKDSVVALNEPIDSVHLCSLDSGIVTECIVSQPTANNMEQSQPSSWLELMLPVAITLFVVFLEKWVTRWYDRRDEREARKRYRETILDWINKIQPTEKAFSNSVHILADAIAKSDDMQPVAFTMPITLHDKLNSMTIESMTDAFLRDFKENKDERYNNMYNIISNMEYLSKIGVSVYVSYNSYNQQTFNLCREWNVNYGLLIDKIIAISGDNPYRKEVHYWFHALEQKPNSINVHIKYLDKLHYLANDQSDYELLSIIIKMRRIAVQNKSTSEGFAKNFKEIADYIDFP